MSDTNPSSRFRIVLLITGAAAGLLLAASGLMESWSFSSDSLPENAIARVGEQFVPEERFLELITDLETDKRSPLDASDRVFVLERLIDEELLIMRGIELGLPQTSPEVRKSIAAVLIAQIASEAEATPATEADLRRLYESDSKFFASTPRFRLQWWRIPGTDQQAEHNAARAFSQLSANRPIREVEQSFGLQPEALLPDELLPPGKLSDYIGPSLTKQVSGLKSGEFSRPLASQDDFHIFHMLDRQERVTPPFEQIRPLVETEYMRRAADLALRQYLAWLRERTEIILPVEMHE